MRFRPQTARKKCATSRATREAPPRMAKAPHPASHPARGQSDNRLTRTPMQRRPSRSPYTVSVETPASYHPRSSASYTQRECLFLRLVILRLSAILEFLIQAPGKIIFFLDE